VNLKFKIVTVFFLIVTLLGGSALATWQSGRAHRLYVSGNFTQADLTQISDLVRPNINGSVFDSHPDRILGVHCHENRAMVTVGVQLGPIGGQGRDYILALENGRWSIVDYVQWFS
jgi:hypothetical protein